VVVPSVKEIHLGERAKHAAGDLFDSESLVAIGKLWLALRAIRSSTRLVSRHCLRPGIEAHTSTSDAQNIGEAQVPSGAVKRQLLQTPDTSFDGLARG
jgi:hypothetical protein